MKIIDFIIRRLSTPATVGAFCLVGSSGVLMYFHLDRGLLHRMHQLAGLTMVAVTILHVIKNFKPLVAYLKRIEAWAAAGAVLCAGGAIAGLAVYWKLAKPPRKGPRAKDMMKVIGKAPLHELAPLVDTDFDGLKARLTAKGFVVTSSTTNLVELAKAAQKSRDDAIIAVLTPVE